MQANGLAALAETYGLERAELQRLKFVAESFFEDLREELTRSVAVSFRLFNLAQIVTSAGEVCAGVPTSQIVFLAARGGATALLKVDQKFARAFVDCAIVGGTTPPTPSERKLTTVEERLLGNTLGSACLRCAQRTIAKLLDLGDPLRILRTAETPGIKALDPAERIVLARIECQFGGGSGAIELGLPVEHLDKLSPRLLPTAPKAARSPAGANKVRSSLAAARADLIAVLGEVMMPLETVRALAPGSILTLLPLRNGIPHVELSWAGQKLFSGAAVEHRGWRRFLIQKIGGSDE